MQGHAGSGSDVRQAKGRRSVDWVHLNDLSWAIMEGRFQIAIEHDGRTWEGVRVIIGKRVLRQRVESP
ncbi:hypothetical protein MOJ79_16975 [Calidifontimicrobium sp. SYSU G02091]|uniref:hypothetical protein n=1 Tax=Calidifontimicrobium sp. SYSU G02091 TaxID=2926421 RepID=UPI001F532632|nr:hypothetical protein [Calidifontimicrobium sp. SYSU G02091]MCI1193526.1 hypothetical protein [Calidifontimicrobium sp. SYSU G02091]